MSDKELGLIKMVKMKLKRLNEINLASLLSDLIKAVQKKTVSLIILFNE